jgi:protein-S-isoprenylcysteine O-methyltransferase Ste14
MNTPDPASPPPVRLPWPPIMMAMTVGLGLALDKIAGEKFGDALDAPALRVAGATLIVTALSVDIWCARALARRQTTILPHRAASTLVTEGPYSFSRNPIYIAHMTLTLGLGLLLGSPFVVTLTPLLALGLQKRSIEPEERHLLEKFGEDFRAYMARTPRWL